MITLNRHGGAVLKPLLVSLWYHLFFNSICENLLT